MPHFWKTVCQMNDQSFKFVGYRQLLHSKSTKNYKSKRKKYIKAKESVDKEKEKDRGRSKKNEERKFLENKLDHNITSEIEV